jgi:ferric-dicitrate binding protein FerR (iron transport regulator)
MNHVESSKQALDEFHSERRLWDMTLLNADVVLNRKRQVIRVRTLLKAAAVIGGIIICSTVAYLGFNRSSEVGMITIQAPAGGRTELQLADGSKVYLNGKTTFSYPASFDKGERVVSISGEGYFEVVKSETPFTVKSQRCEIRVYGTVFNVKDYEDESSSSVSLLEGSVSVSLNRQEHLLCPDEMLVFDDLTCKKDSIDNPDIFLWREGYLVFDDAPFEEMIGSLEKYFDVKLQVRNPSIKAYRCTGKFLKSEGLEHILKVLKKTITFEYELSNNELLIY